MLWAILAACTASNTLPHKSVTDVDEYLKPSCVSMVYKMEGPFTFTDSVFSCGINFKSGGGGKGFEGGSLLCGVAGGLGVRGGEGGGNGAGGGGGDAVEGGVGGLLTSRGTGGGAGGGCAFDLIGLSGTTCKDD